MRRAPAIAALALAAASAGAQPYPTRPVRVIVNFPPGAGSDVATRLVTGRLGESLGQQFVVDNRAGAAGNIGVEIAARAAPDGYTLLTITAAATISQTISRKPPYDLARDFVPVAMLASAPFLLAVHPSVPVKSLQELIALAKAKPGTLSYASPGSGSSPHLTGELLKSLTGIDLVHVPYKGVVPAVTDVAGGSVSMVIGNTLAALPAVRSGRLRAIAITSATRSAIAPDLPTVAESGFPGFEAGTWYGVLAPAGTPPAIPGRLNTAIARILQTADVREKLLAQGAEPALSTPAQMGEFMRSEIAKWGKVVKASGARVD